MQRHETTQSRNRRAHRVLLLSVLIVGCGLVDLVLTLREMTGPGMVELNPIACMLARQGIHWLVAYKLMLMSLNSGLLVLLRRRHQAEKAAWTGAVIMIGLMVHWGMYFESPGNSRSSGMLENPRFVKIEP